MVPGCAATGYTATANADDDYCYDPSATAYTTQPTGRGCSADGIGNIKTSAAMTLAQCREWCDGDSRCAAIAYTAGKACSGFNDNAIVFTNPRDVHFEEGIVCYVNIGRRGWESNNFKLECVHMHCELGTFVV